MNRRSLLTGGTASVLLPGAAKAAVVQPHPDADLIAACTEFLRIQRAWDAYAQANPGDIEADDPNVVMLEPLPALVEQIVALRATKAEGHLARARCMAFPYLPGHSACHENPKAAEEDRFEAAQLRDLVAMERGTETPCAIPPVAADELSRAIHPDAELLAACAGFDALEGAYIAVPGDLEAHRPAGSNPCGAVCIWGNEWPNDGLSGL